MTKRSFAVMGVLLAIATAFICLQMQRATRLGAEVAALQSRMAAAEANRQDNARLEEELSTATGRAEAVERELARLRSERILLQKENAQLKSARSTPTVQPPRHPTEVAERQPYHYTPEQSAFWIERLDFGKRLGLALITLADQNSGQLPAEVSPAAKWLATNNIPIEGDTGPLNGVGVRSFELVYKGNLQDLNNPGETIMAREVDPVEVHAERWTRMYVFADGSVQRLEATKPDGFAEREREVWPGQPQQ